MKLISLVVIDRNGEGTVLSFIELNPRVKAGSTEAINLFLSLHSNIYFHGSYHIYRR